MAKRKKARDPQFEAEVCKLYGEGMSTIAIAKKLNTYSSKITRTLKENNVTLRNRSTAQSAYLNKTDNHPTKGKKRPLEVRKKISTGVHETWTNKPEVEKEAMRDKMRDIWNSQTPEFHAKRREAAHKAIRKASMEGSQIEKFMLIALRDFGYKVEFHRKNLIPNENLELDLFLPGLKTVIEIDGPTHFKPIWGAEKLLKNQKADRQKSGLVQAAGYCMIRIKYDIKYWSEVQAQIIVEQVVERLEKIEAKFPSSQNRYIEIEALN